jgi:phospholipid-binding lipoprotein MlaA
LAACGAPGAGDGIYDPLEPMNRAVHGLNKGLDRVFIEPLAKGSESVIPEPLRRGVTNVADTLELPGDIANDLLQANVKDAGTNTLRLGMNLTFGLAGLFDFATALGLPKSDTDFGETLHVWGVGEGPYVELPVFGPSTLRDAVGLAVDMAADPVNNVFSGRDATAAAAVSFFSRLDTRARYSDTVESILYDSADSYAQARILYLQNRRFELSRGTGGGADSTDDFIDPYEE